MGQRLFRHESNMRPAHYHQGVAAPFQRIRKPVSFRYRARKGANPHDVVLTELLLVHRANGLEPQVAIITELFQDRSDIRDTDSWETGLAVYMCRR